MQEERESLSASFITLTYDDQNLVTTPNGFPSLSKYDLQLFFKRLRKAHVSGKAGSAYQGNSYKCRYRGISFNVRTEQQPIKYYAVGEYGSRTFRPHYHIILLNADIELIESAWSCGQVHYGSVSGASVGYTLKYLCKRQTIGKYGEDDRHPEFSVMSKGIGYSYLGNELICNWHLQDLENRVYVNVGNGKKAAMPRYIRDRLYLEGEKADVRDAQELLVHDRTIESLEKWTPGIQRVHDAYKKHNKQLLINHADKGRTKI